jgi:hypothetical protein
MLPPISSITSVREIALVNNSDSYFLVVKNKAKKLEHCMYNLFVAFPT